MKRLFTEGPTADGERKDVDSVASYPGEDWGEGMRRTPLRVLLLKGARCLEGVASRDAAVLRASDSAPCDELGRGSGLSWRSGERL